MFGRTDVLLRLLWKPIVCISSSQVSTLPSSAPPSSETLWWCKGGHNYTLQKCTGSRFLGGGYGRRGHRHHTDSVMLRQGPTNTIVPVPKTCSKLHLMFFMLHDQGGYSHSLSESRKNITSHWSIFPVKWWEEPVSVESVNRNSRVRRAREGLSRGPGHRQHHRARNTQGNNPLCSPSNLQRGSAGFSGNTYLKAVNSGMQRYQTFDMSATVPWGKKTGLVYFKPGCQGKFHIPK